MGMMSISVDNPVKVRTLPFTLYLGNLSYAPRHLSFGWRILLIQDALGRLLVGSLHAQLNRSSPHQWASKLPNNKEKVKICCCCQCKDPGTEFSLRSPDLSDTYLIAKAKLLSLLSWKSTLKIFLLHTCKTLLLAQIIEFSRASPIDKRQMRWHTDPRLKARPKRSSLSYCTARPAKVWRSMVQKTNRPLRCLRVPLVPFLATRFSVQRLRKSCFLGRLQVRGLRRWKKKLEHSDRGDKMTTGSCTSTWHRRCPSILVISSTHWQKFRLFTSTKGGVIRGPKLRWEDSPDPAFECHQTKEAFTMIISRVTRYPILLPYYYQRGLSV